MVEHGVDYICDCCSCDLSNLVQVRCAVCPEYDLCVPCFAKGAASGNHKPWHDYLIIDQNSYPIFDEKWGADEELLLIEGCEQFGLGSWQDIAEHIGGRTCEEVGEHYSKIYLESPTYPVPDLTKSFTVDPTEFIEERRQRLERFRQEQSMALSAIKPKPLASVPACHDIQGFMPGRLEFDTEIENDAELAVKDMVFDSEDTELDVQHKLVVLEAYNSKLTRRAERKRIVFTHNLLDYKRLVAAEKRRTRDDRELYNKLKPYVRLLPPGEFEKFASNILMEQQCRRRIAELQEYRQNGIKTLQAASKYQHDKIARYSALNRISVPSHANEEAVPTIKLRKSGMIPLDISNAAEVDLLSSSEVALCSQLRIMPQCYLVIKQALFQEMLQHNGNLKRTELELGSVSEPKLTRIYDFFQSQNWIA